jgi:glycopeptide antibiotics resistance protein
MNTRAVNISSLVILLSLISFIAEACVYYLINQHWISVIAAIILSVGISHFCLESSLNYGYSFLHAAFMVTITFIFSVIIYIIQPNRWIPYDFSLVALVLINWITPFVYCSIRDLLDRGPRFTGFRDFFSRMSLLFVVFFLFVIIKQYFLTPIKPPYQELPFGAHNFVPGMTTASYIEFSLYNNIGMTPLFHYMIEMICLGIPVGFFVRIYGGRFPFLVRLMIYFAIPILLEIFQEITGRGWGDIDDVTMSLFGILLGVILYHLMNGISQSVSNREFMMERNQNSNYFS